MSVMVYPCMFCVALLMDLFVLCVACLTVFVNCVLHVCELFGETIRNMFGETIRNMFGCVCYFLLNVMDLFSVAGGALLDRPCMVFQRMCVLCL